MSTPSDTPLGSLNPSVATSSMEFIPLVKSIPVLPPLDMPKPNEPTPVKLVEISKERYDRLIYLERNISSIIQVAVTLNSLKD